MGFKTTLYLFFTVCLLGGLLYLVQYRKKAVAAERHRSSLVFDFAQEKIEGMALQRHGERLECVKKDGTWFLRSPILARADAAAMEKMVAAFEDLKWNDRITVDRRRNRGLSAADYGLEPPKIKVVLDTGTRRLVLDCGDATPFGDGMYVRRHDSDDILIVPHNLLQSLSNSVEELRNRSVLHGKPDDTVRIDIARREAGFIQLVRKDGVWHIMQPLVARAEQAEVQIILDALYGLQVQSFVWDMQVGASSQAAEGGLELDAGAKIESCGLARDEAAVVVTVYVDGDSLGQELILGGNDEKHPGLIFAKRGKNSSIYAVKSDVLNLLQTDINMLRDRRLFYLMPDEVESLELMRGESRLIFERDTEKKDDWLIVDPVQWQADRREVAGLLDKVLGIKVGKYLEQPVEADTGLDSPAFAIDLKSGGTESADTVMRSGRLLLGARFDERNLFAKIAGRDEVFTVGSDDVAWLADSNSVAAIRYCNRTMMAVEPAHVRRITVAALSGDCSIERSAEGGWNCLSQTNRVPAQAHITAILKRLEGLRALSIVKHNPDSLEKYGLDVPRVTLTVGLQGEDNVLKSILAGKSNGRGASYAMIRGQDIVFTIPDDIVKDFAAPICNPAATSDKPPAAGAAQ